MLTAPWSNDLPMEQRPDVYLGFDTPIPEDFVLARFSNGSPRATFSQDNWQFGSDREESISFTNIVGLGVIDNHTLYDKIVYQAKCIMFALIYTPKIRSQRVQPSTMRSRLKVIRRLAKLCYLEGITFQNMATSQKFQNDLKLSISSLANGWTNKSAAYQTKITFDEYHKALEVGSFKWLGLSRIYPLDDVLPYSLLINRAINALRNKGSERTMLIPRRLLANIIDNGLSRVYEMLPYTAGIIKYAKLYATKKEYDHANMLMLSGLNDVDSLNSSKTPRDLTTYLSTLQDVCRLLTHAFTGMRDSEVKVLPWDAYIEYDIPNYGVAPFIQGHHRKMKKRNYSGRVQWVTSPEMKYVIELAQSIALAKAIMFTRNLAIDTSKLPLWIGSYNILDKGNDHYDFGIRMFNLCERYWEKFSKLLDLNIEQDDLIELYKFDSYRDWSKKKNIKVGMPWPISTHQFRRSLAVYASRSGMVSLPSLGNQYKHISLHMTAMYADKSTFADHFIPRKEMVKRSMSSGLLMISMKRELFKLQLIFMSILLIE